MQKNSMIIKFGVAAAVVVGGLTLAAQPSMAAAAGFSVTPATGLSDGAAVTVAISGAGANEGFNILQCANVGDALACNVDTVKAVTTNASGASSTAFTVKKTFQGVTPDGASVGAVNCATTACYISTGNATSFLGSKQITFS